MSNYTALSSNIMKYMIYVHLFYIMISVALLQNDQNGK